MLFILGLGSNLGDRAAYLNQCIARLSEFISDITCSPVYESKAVLLPGSPASWNIDFLNAAISGTSPLSPSEMLQKIKNIEKKLGRNKLAPRWSPRHIDIDILAVEDTAINENNLQIPHPFLLERPFALWPLADIAPGWKYPVKGENFRKSALELAQKFDRPQLSEYVIFQKV